jgi:hypothetical protein
LHWFGAAQVLRQNVAPLVVSKHSLPAGQLPAEQLLITQ